MLSVQTSGIYPLCRPSAGFLKFFVALHLAQIQYNLIKSAAQQFFDLMRLKLLSVSATRFRRVAGILKKGCNREGMGNDR